GASGGGRDAEAGDPGPPGSGRRGGPGAVGRGRGRGRPAGQALRARGGRRRRRRHAGGDRGDAAGEPGDRGLEGHPDRERAAV
ncbi:MAG: Phosphoribosylformylglycinamidine synthase, PurS subunit, partial [uncultured Pseudonocardia sp.]